jgi:hypothetical protein
MFRASSVTSGLIAVLAALLASAAAQFGVPLSHTDPQSNSSTARELVEQYCRRDYAGARLDLADWPKLQPLVSWRSNLEYPLIMVSSRFDVDPEPVPQHGKFLVIVHYRLIGRYDMGQGYSVDSSRSVQDVTFVVSEINGEWRISDIDPNYPHPSRAAVLQWLNTKLSQPAPDPASKVIYQHAVQDLQPAKSSTSPK